MKSDEMQKVLLCILLFLAAISIYSFYRLRYDSGIFTYDEYKYIEKAERIISDNYSSGALKNNLADPAAILVALTGNAELFMRLLPYFFAVINLALIYVLAKRLPIKDNHRLYSFVYLILSPLFIYAHTTFNLPFIALTLLLAGILFFFYNNPLLGLIFMLLCLWVNPWCFFIIATFLVFSMLRIKDTKKGFEVFALLFIAFIFLLLKGIGIPAGGNLLVLAKDYVTDLGSAYGIGIFGLLTTAIGIFLFLRNKEKDKTPLWFIMMLGFFSIYDKFFLVFFDVFAAYFSGFGMVKILHGNWESSILKNYVALLIFCGLVFSAGSYLNKTYKSGADYGERISIDWLKNNAEQDKKILSYYEFGYFLSTGGAEPFTDKDYFLYSKERGRINESNKIFMERDLKKISAFLRKNNIKYIWINTAMKDSLVWSKEDEGMLFVLDNSVAFNLVYNYLNVQIWEYVPN